MVRIGNQTLRNQFPFLWLIFILLFNGFFLGCQRPTPIPFSSRQMILVITPSNDAHHGTLVRYEREDGKYEWSQMEQAIPAVVGKHGLGWGRGLHEEIPSGIPMKQEGDGKSPAGVFLLSSAFGFLSPDEVGDLKMPYTKITDMLECVDDSESVVYNRVVRRDEVDSVDWKSSEKMIKYKTAYEWGVVVEHNTDETVHGAGSCIFLHVWSGPDGWTTGCTAMEKSHMEAILYWLDSSKESVMVQLTQTLYDTFKRPWRLPNLPPRHE